VSGPFPLRYVHSNVLFGPGGARAAVYRLEMVAYPFLPVGEKWRWLRTLERFASLIAANFSIYRVNRAYPAERYPSETSMLLDPRTRDPEAFTALLDGHRRRLAQLASHLPEVYVVVSLADEAPGGFGAGLLRAAGRARRRVEDLAGLAAAQPIGAGELDAITAAEQRLFEQVRGVLACERASTREIEWLLRRGELRGLGEPPLDRYWEPDALVIETDGAVSYLPLELDLWQCVNAPVSEPAGGPPRLLVEGESGVSHQALLCLGALADAPEFPGPMAELLFAPLEAVPFAVDAVGHFRWVGNRQALAQVRKRITDVEQVYRDQAQGDARGPGLLAHEDRVLAREYEAVLQSSGHPPMLYGSIGLAVGASDERELEERVTALRDRFGELALHRPRGLQEQLYLDHLPRPDAGNVRDYTQQLTVEQFGALMPIATQRLGATDGIYLGLCGGSGGRPVKYDVTAPAREDRTSTVLLCGTLGSGKSVAAQAIAYGAALRGSEIIDFDPKPDHGLDRIPQLTGRVNVLELSGAAEHRGALDPLAIGLDDDMREELAGSYYLDLLRSCPPAWEVAIQRAIRDTICAGERSSLGVIERLRAAHEPAAREAGEALGVLADFGLARLGFGDEDTPLAVGAAAQVTTIRTPGLTLPDPRASRETYTRVERVSVATLSLVAALAMRLVSRDRSTHKVVLLDEAWFLLASTLGRALISRLVLLGRAFNATVLLATQLLAHVGDLSDLVGSYLIFGQESDAEAQRALTQLALDPDDRALVARLRGYRKGRCLMRDLEGRIGELQIDLVFPELLDALNTTPGRA
jgi:hypothetical protein